MTRKNGLLIFSFIVVLVLSIGCEKKGGLVYPSLPKQFKVNSSLSLEVKNDTGKDLEFKWWTKYADQNWVIAKDWGAAGAFTVTPDKPGIWAVQVDVREKGQPTELEKKWLGQFTAQ